MKLERKIRDTRCNTRAETEQNFFCTNIIKFDSIFYNERKGERESENYSCESEAVGGKLHAVENVCVQLNFNHMKN
jgi:hypothetical protein